MFSNEINDFHAAFFVDSDAFSDDEHVVDSRLAVTVDGSGVLAVVAFGDGGQVVSRRQVPSSFMADEAEVFGMVVFVVGEHVESHQSEHGFHLFWVLGQITCEVQ